VKAPAVDVAGELHGLTRADCDAEAAPLADLFIDGDANALLCLGHDSWFFAALVFPAGSLCLPGLPEKTADREDWHGH
jgi:hypothetical protein